MRSRAVRGSGRSKRTCSTATVHAGGRGAAAEDVSAVGIAIDPGVCARAGSSVIMPAVATAAKITARLQKTWRCMMFVSSLLEFFFLFGAFLIPPPLLTCFGLERPQMRGVDDHSGNAPADAIVHALGEHVILSGGIEVESAGVGPMPHNGEPVEQRNLVLLR